MSITTPLPESAVDLAVELALHARVPGGAEVWHWLPQTPEGHPHSTSREVIKAALLAALPAIREAVGMEYAGLAEKWREDAETPDMIAWTTRHSLRRCADELAALTTTTQEARHDER